MVTVPVVHMWCCDQHLFCTCGATLITRRIRESCCHEHPNARRKQLGGRQRWLLGLRSRHAPVEAVGTLHAISEDGNYNLTHRPSSTWLVILDCLIRIGDIAFCCCCCSVSCITFTGSRLPEHLLFAWSFDSTARTRGVARQCAGACGTHFETALQRRCANCRGFSALPTVGTLRGR